MTVSLASFAKCRSRMVSDVRSNLVLVASSISRAYAGCSKKVDR